MCMACAASGHHVYRLRLNGGGYVFMEWHRYFGPSFWRDHACTREIDDWDQHPEICAALDWFCERGKKA